MPRPNAEPTIGYGLLEAVDLSLLANPTGFIASIKYAAALSNDLPVDKVCSHQVYR